MAQICVACGMPMQRDEDFAGADHSRPYCRYCARPDGSMQSYTEKLAALTAFIARTQRLELKAAEDIAREKMARLPAWSGTR